MVSDVTVGTALGQQQNTANAGTQLGDDFAQFLNLLTVQLQNQDPLSPMDTTEFTNQLVAFTGVEQQINTNQKLDSLVALELSSALGESLQYIGKEVTYISPEFNFDGVKPVEIKYALNGDAVFAKIRIKDEAGEIIFEEDIDRSTGRQEFTWDGTTTNGDIAEPGTYEVIIDALDIDDQAVSSTIVVSGTVRGIETQNGGLFVLVGERAISLGNIISVVEPDVLPPPDDIDDTDDTDDTDTDDPPTDP